MDVWTKATVTSYLNLIYFMYMHKLATVFCILSVSREGTNCAGETEKTSRGSGKRQHLVASQWKKIAYWVTSESGRDTEWHQNSTQGQNRNLWLIAGTTRSWVLREKRVLIKIFIRLHGLLKLVSTEHWVWEAPECEQLASFGVNQVTFQQQIKI